MEVTQLLLIKQKTTVAVISDTHIGSTVALCPPNLYLDDGQSIEQSKAQKWLWCNWKDFIDFSTHLNKKLYIFHLGDVFENAHHEKTQLWSINEADWKKAAYETFSDFFSKAQHRFVIRGTPAHAKTGASLEEEFALSVKAEQENERWSTWTRKVYVNDVLFDLAHKGPVGQLPWTISNPLNRLAFEVIANCCSRHTKLPDIILRSHNHTYGTSSDNCPVLVISMPAWQLCTEYIQTHNPVKMSSIGGIVFECWDGKYEIHKKLYIPKEEEPWKEQ